VRSRDEINLPRYVSPAKGRVHYLSHSSCSVLSPLFVLFYYFLNLTFKSHFITSYGMAQVLTTQLLEESSYRVYLSQRRPSKVAPVDR